MNRLELRYAIDELLLPSSVRSFRRSARALAEERGDEFSTISTQRATGLRRVLKLARGRRNVVELGTATGWTAAVLVLADGSRHVTTFDPIVREHRDAYLDLLTTADRARLSVFDEDGALGASRVEGVDFIFLDSSHEREPTVAEFKAWRPRLAPGGIVVFDDYGHPEYPGVAQAVGDLGLTGKAHGTHFVWTAPGA